MGLRKKKTGRTGLPKKHWKKRGPKPCGNAMDCRVIFRLKKDQHKEAWLAAKAEGMTISGWIRMLVVKEAMRTSKSALFA